jgi:hypothetical protein
MAERRQRLLPEGSEFFHHIDNPDQWQPRLLRLRRQRPCRRTAEPRNEIAPSRG